MSRTRRRQHSRTRGPAPESGEQAGHELRHAVQSLEHGAHLLAGEDDGQPRRPLGAYHAIQPGEIDLQHVAVQEQQGAERLVLGRGGDVTVHGQ
jgi:hypothetical protein